MADDLLRSWVQEHSATLHRIARAFAAPADQPDLMQEILLSLWRAAPGFRGASGAKTFVYRVALNKALTWRRRDKLRLWRFHAPAPEMDRVADHDPDDRLDRLYGAIRKLDLMDRALILMSLEGMSYRDIAELHGLSESNTGARLSRIRAKLTKMIEAASHDQ